ncbi:MAG: diguanylate cyclase [Acidobacteria bacterium]|nr:diguanylate cyclase [Acidobacteriota bacterium]
MSPDREQANVLILTDDEEAGRRLYEAVIEAGELPVLVSGAERNFLEKGDDEKIDLVVTQLDTQAPSGYRLLEKLLTGDLFFGVPQVHLFRDTATRDSLSKINPDIASVSLVMPDDASEFPARLRLSAEVGRLRRLISRVAIQDSLTGLHNRRFLLMRLDQEFSRARRHGFSLSLVLFDIDQLRQINDTYGLEAGDRAIREVGGVLSPLIRLEDVVGRWGESSFAAILPGTPHRGAAVFANRVRGDAKIFSIEADGQTVQLRLSAGISSYDSEVMNDCTDLIRATERALEEAKRRGGNRVFIDKVVMAPGRRLVLVADPDATMLDLAEDLLSMDDLQIIRATTTESLIRTLEFRRPDVIVLDLRMDGDHEPAVLVEKVRSQFPEDRIPIIGMCSGTRSWDEADGLGVDRYITKPFSASVLRSLVNELIGQGFRHRANPTTV